MDNESGYLDTHGYSQQHITRTQNHRSEESRDSQHVTNNIKQASFFLPTYVRTRCRRRIKKQCYIRMMYALANIIKSNDPNLRWPCKPQGRGDSMCHFDDGPGECLPAFFFWACLSLLASISGGDSRSYCGDSMFNVSLL